MSLNNVDDISIQFEKCFVFNRKFEGKAEEDDYLKIIGYYPPNKSINDKMISVGVVEALTSFSKTFGSETVCDSLFTDNSKFVFIEPEPGYWMALFVKHSSTTTSSSQQPSSSSSSSSTTGPIQDFSVYNDGNLPYLLLKSKLQDAYQTFRVFHGEMDQMVRTNGIDSLRASVDLFLENYWRNVSFNNWNVFDILGGVHYLPILPNDFLSIQSFISQLIFKFSSFKTATARGGGSSSSSSSTKVNSSSSASSSSSSNSSVIRGCLFLFDSYLVYNGISQEESRIISHYLPNIIDERIKYNYSSSSPQQQQNSANSTTSTGNGIFITGPEDIQSSVTRFSAPKVYINHHSSNLTEEVVGGGGSEASSNVIIYKMMNRLQLVLFVDPSVLSNLNFYTNLRDYMNEDLNNLYKTLSDYIFKNGDSVLKYIFFNGSSLALKTSLNMQTPSMALRETLQNLCTIRSQLKVNEAKEIILKNKKEGWVALKSVAEKELFFIIEQKNITLTDVQQQIEKASVLFNSSK